MNLDEIKNLKTIEKATDFDFLIKFVAFLTYINTTYLLAYNKSLTTGTTFILTTEMPVGRMTITFAGFCFLMAWVLPIMRMSLQRVLGNTIDAIYLKITREPEFLLQRDGYYLECHAEELFCKTNNKYIEKIIDSNKQQRQINEAKAKISFSLSALLMIDVIVSLSFGSYKASFVYLVCSLGEHLPKIISTPLQFFIWVFAIAIFFFGLSWRLHELYVYLPAEIIKALNIQEITIGQKASDEGKFLGQEQKEGIRGYP